MIISKKKFKKMESQIEDQKELLSQRKAENEGLIKIIKDVYREAEEGNVLKEGNNPYEHLRNIKKKTQGIYERHISFLDDILKKKEFKKMSDEELIEYLKNNEICEIEFDDYGFAHLIKVDEAGFKPMILNLIDKLQKENKELKEELDYYKQKEKQDFDERDYYEE